MILYDTGTPLSLFYVKTQLGSLQFPVWLCFSIFMFLSWCFSFAMCCDLKINIRKMIQASSFLHLRILAMHEAKREPLVHFDNFINTQSSKNLWASFFDQLSIDVKNAFTFEKWPLVAVLKFNMSGNAVFSEVIIYSNVNTSMDTWSKNWSPDFWKSSIMKTPEHWLTSCVPFMHSPFA